MSFSAVVPVSDMAAANATLAANGWGPTNFSIPVYTGPRPTHATLHAWSDAAFQADVEAIPGVIVSAIDGTPAERVADALSSVSGQWGGNAPELAGEVTPGLYREGDDLVWVIQAFNRDVFGQPVGELPALMRFARTPGTVTDWVQPIDQFDAYLMTDPFTGEPERVMHNGATWEVVQADGAGNNVWEPGVFGWAQV